MRIDAHQHYWDPAENDYGWLDQTCGPLFRAFGPHDLEPQLVSAGIDRTILVQAAPTMEETHYLLALAAWTPRIAGVVGWADLAALDAAKVVTRLSRIPILKGLRPMLQDLEDPEWITRSDVRDGLDAMSHTGLVFDALVRADQIPHIATVANRHPGLAIVLDHGGKPQIGSDLSKWRQDISDLASRPNVTCKLSGLLTQAPPGAGAEVLRPVVGHLLDAFGPERLMWGSDWPVLTTVADYFTWLSVTTEMLDRLTEHEWRCVIGGTAALVYRIDP